jgi:hypothetical protein
VEVLICETETASLSTNFEANYSGAVPIAVFELDTLSIDWTKTSPGWNGFDLDTPFQYSGSGNLIVEFRYLGHDGKTVNARAAALPQADRCLSGAFPNSATGSLMSFLTCMRLHYDSAGLEGRSFGLIKTFF